MLPCDLVEPALMEIGLSVDPEGSGGGRLRETRLWVVAAAAAAATAGGRSWRQRRCDKETLLLLKKKKIKFFRVRIFLLFFVVKNAPLLN